MLQEKEKYLEELYKTANHFLNKDKEAYLYEAKRIFKDLSAFSYKDSCEKEELAIKKIETISSEKEANLTKKEKDNKRNKMIWTVSSVVICVIATFVVVLNVIIIPNNKYNSAITLMNEGKYTEAYDMFMTLDGYKDSLEKADLINTVMIPDRDYNNALELMNNGKLEEAYTIFRGISNHRDSNEHIKKILQTRFSNAKIGDIIEFGLYEQDNDISNGREDVEWKVLDVKDNKILVISNCALDWKPYNEEHEYVTWETCTLRKWLNSDFINDAFVSDQKDMIITTKVTADKNPEYNTNSGNDTEDKVFLLSIKEVNNYLKNEKRCKPTDYAVSNGAHKNISGYCEWSLRTPGEALYDVTYIYEGGGVNEFGLSVTYDYAIRPALWIGID